MGVHAPNEFAVLYFKLKNPSEIKRGFAPEECNVLLEGGELVKEHPMSGGGPSFMG